MYSIQVGKAAAKTLDNLYLTIGFSRFPPELNSLNNSAENSVELSSQKSLKIPVPDELAEMRDGITYLLDSDARKKEFALRPQDFLVLASNYDHTCSRLKRIESKPRLLEVLALEVPGSHLYRLNLDICRFQYSAYHQTPSDAERCAKAALEALLKNPKTDLNQEEIRWLGKAICFLSNEAENTRIGSEVWQQVCRLSRLEAPELQRVKYWACLGRGNLRLDAWEAEESEPKKQRLLECLLADLAVVQQIPKQIVEQDANLLMGVRNLEFRASSHFSFKAEIPERFLQQAWQIAVSNPESNAENLVAVTTAYVNLLMEDVDSPKQAASIATKSLMALRKVEGYDKNAELKIQRLVRFAYCSLDPKAALRIAASIDEKNQARGDFYSVDAVMDASIFLELQSAHSDTPWYQKSLQFKALIPRLAQSARQGSDAALKHLSDKFWQSYQSQDLEMGLYLADNLIAITEGADPFTDRKVVELSMMYQARIDMLLDCVFVNQHRQPFNVRESESKSHPQILLMKQIEKELMSFKTFPEDKTAAYLLRINLARYACILGNGNELENHLGLAIEMQCGGGVHEKVIHRTIYDIAFMLYQIRSQLPKVTEEIAFKFWPMVERELDADPSTIAGETYAIIHAVLEHSKMYAQARLVEEKINESEGPDASEEGAFW